MECEYFKQGRCKFGLACRNKHVLPENEKNTKIPENAVYGHGYARIGNTSYGNSRYNQMGNNYAYGNGNMPYMGSTPAQHSTGTPYMGSGQFSNSSTPYMGSGQFGGMQGYMGNTQLGNTNTPYMGNAQLGNNGNNYPQTPQFGNMYTPLSGQFGNNPGMVPSGQFGGVNTLQGGQFENINNGNITEMSQFGNTQNMPGITQFGNINNGNIREVPQFMNNSSAQPSNNQFIQDQLHAQTQSNGHHRDNDDPYRLGYIPTTPPI
ncbi:uncharacterized protein NEPG_01581 [Nematocida parisii ERTm1]|uniref:C3H1-type domain-containing protein n=1 Tax=Nematocida parisii (strain ERTm3) TaxID=935791 RepID=I3EJ14_NEMP3|nr:uncharacterized protein NEPG_01581 [Nematocida parisii ERTm1]EIJ89211.1 hypothetical protein NEQG_01030 [Nematocida parisii ERTm3]EIJ93239.1 hypothetical protein NEPG_01581 [Nematocida parisii ERTm1]KAI5142939.1 hypothetical protein NEPAR07_0393 [Nematocida parisii]|eukprot:XP_013059409.1 hypothetical protein NEPG_01581 [Nematocida parisii ERTm1]